MTDRILPPNAHLIPESAQRVFEGKLFDVYQWQQPLFNGEIETWEMLKRPDTIVVIAIDEGQVIVVNEEQADGMTRRTSPILGRVESGESPLEAAQRETLEETGMEFVDWKLISVKQPESKIEWFVYTFLARHKSAQYEQKLDAGEKIEVSRVDFEAFKQTQSRFARSVLGDAATLEEFLADAKEVA